MAKRWRRAKDSKGVGSPPLSTTEEGPAYTLKVGFNTLPRGVESAKFDAWATFIDAKTDWNEKAREVLYADEQKSPHTNLSPTSGRVSVRTALQLISFQRVGGVVRYADGRTIHDQNQGGVVTVTPPNDTIVVTDCTVSGLIST
jgi:hypothetical protein